MQWKPRLEENQENTANRQWKKGTFGESGSRRYAGACATTHPDMTAEFMELEERLDECREDGWKLISKPYVTPTDGTND